MPSVLPLDTTVLCGHATWQRTQVIPAFAHSLDSKQLDEFKDTHFVAVLHQHGINVYVLTSCLLAYRVMFRLGAEACYGVLVQPSFGHPTTTSQYRVVARSSVGGDDISCLEELIAFAAAGTHGMVKGTAAVISSAWF